MITTRVKVLYTSSKTLETYSLASAIFNSFSLLSDFVDIHGVSITICERIDYYCCCCYFCFLFVFFFNIMHQVANKHSSFTTDHTLYTTVTVSTVIFDSLTRFVTSQSLANLKVDHSYINRKIDANARESQTLEAYTHKPKLK